MKAELKHQEVQSRTTELKKDSRGRLSFVDNRNTAQIKLINMIQCAGLEDKELQLNPVAQLQSEDGAIFYKNFETIQRKQGVFQSKSSINSHKTPTLQLASRILSSGSQQYDCGLTNTVEVGSHIEVALDPRDLPRGQSANINTSQNDMMTEIRKKWSISGGDVVKGHLWNDNLGGSAMNYNLYPITRGANKDHLMYVENIAKKQLYNGSAIYYKVEVDAEPSIKKGKADFDCEIRDWDVNTNQIGALLCPPITICSDLANTGIYNEAYETYTGRVDISRIKSTKMPKWLKRPKTLIGELTKVELWNRNNQ